MRCDRDEAAVCRKRAGIAGKPDVVVQLIGSVCFYRRDRAEG